MIRLVVDHTELDPVTVAAFVEKYLKNAVDSDITCKGIPIALESFQSSLDDGENIVLDHGQVVYKEHLLQGISSNQYMLLYYLIVNRGRICPKRSIIQYIWPDRDDLLVANSLKKLVQKLRNNLDQGPGRDYITTVNRLGYVIHNSS